MKLCIQPSKAHSFVFPSCDSCKIVPHSIFWTCYVEIITKHPAKFRLHSYRGFTKSYRISKKIEKRNDCFRMFTPG